MTVTLSGSTTILSKTMTGSEVTQALPANTVRVLMYTDGTDCTLATETSGTTFLLRQYQVYELLGRNYGGRTLYLDGTAAKIVYFICELDLVTD